MMEAVQVAHGSADYLRLARAKWLSWASLDYMALEGLVAIVAGSHGTVGPHGFVLVWDARRMGPLELLLILAVIALIVFAVSRLVGRTRHR